jgi:hypothetical protein
MGGPRPASIPLSAPQPSALEHLGRCQTASVRLGRRMRLAYTPRQCSWLNQIAMWFGILWRKLLRRSSLASAEELKAKVLAFIDYCNTTMAKPIDWLYSPRPLFEPHSTG